MQIIEPAGQGSHVLGHAAVDPGRRPRRSDVPPPAGLYLHWPYCLSKCTYCDFVTGPERPGQIGRYASALLKEIQCFDPDQSPELSRVDTIYWGGGTPSRMPEEVLWLAMNACRRQFSIDSDAEITLEVNPGTVSLEKARVLRKSGINRISLGIESLHDEELARLNRGHTVAQAIESFEICRRVGFDNIACDLICGLPRQTQAQWRNNVQGMVHLAPEHISVYLLELHPRTRMAGEVRSGKLALPPEDETIERYYDCIDLLQAAGYEHYEISSFARLGRQSRHNAKYWNDVAFAGFGTGAHQYFGGVRSRNDPKIESYMGRVQRSGSGIAESEALDFRMWLTEFAITALRQRKGIDLGSFQLRYGFSFEEFYREPVERMMDLGMLELRRGCLRLTRRALILSNEVFQEFL